MLYISAIAMHPVVPVFEPEGDLIIIYDNLIVGAAQQLAPERIAQRPFVKCTVTLFPRDLDCLVKNCLQSMSPQANAQVHPTFSLQ